MTRRQIRRPARRPARWQARRRTGRQPRGTERPVRRRTEHPATRPGLRRLVCGAYLAAAVAGGLATAPPAGASDLHLVHQGESIQAAVDAARPGDPVLIGPGVYRESVVIKESGVTLRGS